MVGHFETCCLSSSAAPGESRASYDGQRGRPPSFPSTALTVVFVLAAVKMGEIGFRERTRLIIRKKKAYRAHMVGRCVG